MRAAVITGQHQLELIDVPDPTPTPGSVVVDIAFCGVCGTDIHAYQSGAAYNPAICGHEWAGTISAIGAGVTSWTDGDRVVVAVPPSCGRCAPCRAGQSAYCSTVFLSATGRDVKAPRHGGFASRIAVAADRLVATHPALDDAEAAQVEPTTVAFHAVRRSGIRLGDVAVVQGAGPIGLMTLQWVRAAGAGEVVVVEPNAGRAALALSLGATRITEPTEADALVKDLTGGLGADIVYECVGRATAVQSAVDLARRGGTMCLIGLADRDATISPGAWLVKEISVVASLAYTHEEFAMAMAMMADGRVTVGPLHSTTVGLGGFADVMAELAGVSGAGGAPSHIKVLVDPNA